MPSSCSAIIKPAAHATAAGQPAALNLLAGGATSSSSLTSAWDVTTLWVCRASGRTTTTRHNPAVGITSPNGGCATP